MKIGVGTVQLGCDYGVSNQSGQTPLEEAQRILSIARKNGIEVIDTAPAYGESESVLGQAFSTDDIFKIVTKTSVHQSSAITDADAAHLENTFRNSLRVMNRKSLYGLLVHHADNLLQDGGMKLWDTIESLKNRAYVSKIGVSVYNASQIDRILKQFPIDIIQLPVNVLDQRLVQSGHLAYLKEKGVEIHARSVFLQGLLLMDPASLPSYFTPFQETIVRYHRAIKDSGFSPLQAALAFVTNLSEVDSVICGVNTCDQLQDICNAMACEMIMDFREFACDDEALLNPSRWSLDA